MPSCVGRKVQCGRAGDEIKRVRFRDSEDPCEGSAATYRGQAHARNVIACNCETQDTRQIRMEAFPVFLPVLTMYWVVLAGG